MASKKDLVEAQTFSRRRLLTAFVSGTPGGRELEPTKPLRAVVAGIALTGLLVVGSLVLGLLRPGLPEGWDHDSLVVTEDTASRYVALEGTLYPVLNTASARLLISGDFRVVQVDEERIASTPRGLTRGIPGAPDELPTPDRLIDSGWLACVEPDGGLTTILTDGEVPGEIEAARAEAEAAGEAPPAILVSSGGDQYLVVEGRRHLVPRAVSAAVLRAVGQDTVVPWEVGARWLNLFPPGADLDPVTVAGAGDPLPAGAPAPPGAVIGSVVQVTDTGGRYVIDAAGDLAPLSAFALPLYRLGSGAEVGPDLEVTAAQIGAMDTADRPAGGEDWPAGALGALPDRQPACAYLDTDDDRDWPEVSLVAHEDVVIAVGEQAVNVQPAGGALVRSSAGPGLAGPVQLVDQTGTAFPLPDPDAVLGRLGYTPDDVVTVPQAWMALFPTGPALTVEAAARTPQVASASEG